MEHSKLTFLVALAIPIVGAGCLTTPKNDQDVGFTADAVDIGGYLDSGNDEVCVYVSPTETGTYDLLSSDSTPGTKTITVYGDDLFIFAADAEIEAHDWSCIGTTGDAETFLKIQERASGACANSFDAGEVNQTTFDYTWDDGTDLTSCIGANSSWATFVADCPLSTDNPVVRIVAEANSHYNHCAAAGRCDESSEADDDPPCATGSKWCQTTPQGEYNCVTGDKCPDCFKNCTGNLSPSDRFGNDRGDCSWIPATHVGENPGILCDPGNIVLACEPLGL